MKATPPFSFICLPFQLEPTVAGKMGRKLEVRNVPPRRKVTENLGGVPLRRKSLQKY